ncbi:glycosyltransferase [Kocuria sp. cx-116]|uniref:glycosyltransferase n=1 Tax=Kocuria sp. cx-116 TaxID=2771378 RepID=UPI002A4E24B6|nr:glycosyltransferase [Kocuria sp. cx-116]
MPQQTPPRVLLVSMHTSPVDQPGSGDAGGMNVYVLHLARSLSRRGWAVDMATLDRDPSHPAGVSVNQLPDGPRLLAVAVPGAATAPKQRLPAFALAFGRALAAFYHDDAVPLLVHAHYWLSAVASREIRAQLNIPLMLTLHTSAAVKNLRAGPGENPEPVARERAEQEVVATSCTLVVNTPAEADHMVELYGAPRERIRVIPPGVDPAVFYPVVKTAPHPHRAAQSDRVGAPPFTVLCAGRMQPLKGPQVLVAALGLLRRTHPESAVHLILAGAGSPEFLAELHRLTQDHGVADAVQFRGSMPAAELAELMRSADAVAMPSSSETFGLVALEAQACGTPVLATNVDGLRYAVQDHRTGWLVPGRTPQLWAEALYRAASNPEHWRAMSRAAAERARELTWDHAAAQHEVAYMRCAGERVTT